MLERLAPPPTRSLAELTEDMPGRWRSLAEVAWLLAALLGVGWLEALLGRLPLAPGAPTLLGSLAAGLLVVAAYALVRPWRLARRGRRAAAIVIGIALAPVAVATVVGPMVRASAPPPRIGVELADGAAADGRAGAAVGRSSRGAPRRGGSRAGIWCWR
jgi:hypothetical protein